MDFNFFMPVRVISGEGVSENTAAFARLWQALPDYDQPQRGKSGALDDVLGALKQARINHTVFSEISANPLLSQCQAAACAAKLCRSDFIIGVGGGSVMDAAKAAAWLATNNYRNGDGLMNGELRRAPLPLVLIGTTAGTGSEVTLTAVLTMDKTGHKKSITHSNCYADLVFADPATPIPSRATRQSRPRWTPFRTR